MHVACWYVCLHKNENYLKRPQNEDNFQAWNNREEGINDICQQQQKTSIGITHVIAICTEFPKTFEF